MKLYKKKSYVQHKDERGVIDELLNNVNIRSVLYITGKEGAIRGNHVHTHDTHYCLCLSGEIKYQYIESGSKQKKQIVLRRGDMVYTPVQEKHRFIFLKKGAFITFATEVRDSDSYEKDTKRIVF